MSDEQTKQINELKYEGLTALILQGQQHEKLRHDDLLKFVDFRLGAIDTKIATQNGNVAKNLKRIGELESESKERVLTCGAAVAELQKKTKYVKLVKWINEHQKRSVILFTIFFLSTIWFFLSAIENQWLTLVWEALKTIK